jgi:aromatic-L-amino-acid decarboxylase
MADLPGDRHEGRPVADTLGLEPALMRELGHWVVDRVVEHLCDLEREPAIRTDDPGPLREVLGGPLPEQPGDPREALRTLSDTVLAHMQHVDHPRYFARVPGPSSFAAVLGEWLGTGFNSIATSWGGGSGPATVELVVLDWLRALLGLPPGGDGVLVSGGSMGNLTALAAARSQRGPGVAYLSDQAHASITRALVTLGFPPAHVHELAPDRALRLRAATVAQAIAADRDEGRTPRLVIASAGTTNTGAVDALEELADLCAAEDLWLHVDGAYGAPAAMCETGRRTLAGLARADSLVLDPHKWLFQPIDCGCVLVRHPGVLEAAFAMDAEYLRDVRARTGEVDLRNRTLELTRRSRALKLWLTLRIHGAERLREAVARGIELAEHAERLLRADPRWEVVTPASLGIVTFALRGADGADHAARATALSASGFAAVTTTLVGGRSVLRLCTINPRTTREDLAETLNRLAGSRTSRPG